VARAAASTRAVTYLATAQASDSEMEEPSGLRCTRFAALTAHHVQARPAVQLPWCSLGDSSGAKLATNPGSPRETHEGKTVHRAGDPRHPWAA
jgi:hypothetical protein